MKSGKHNSGTPEEVSKEIYTQHL